ncbi:MAG: GDP-L-fucose synthase family protein [Candidatus Kapaibacterium sp.]
MKFNKDSKIFVAGHKGMVGSAITRLLEKEGYSNVITAGRDKADLTRQDETEAFFKEAAPEFIFLAAAKVGGIAANNRYKAEFIYNNLLIAANVINSTYKYGQGKILNLGSSCIYPKHAPQPMKEEHLLTGKLEPTNEPYAIAKIAAIKLCSSFNYQYATEHISLMPTNLYGYNDNYDLEKSHVLPALLRKAVLARALETGNHELIKKDVDRHPLGNGLDDKINPDDFASYEGALAECGIFPDRINVWGTGNVKREFLFVDDLADAALFFMEKGTPENMGEFVNIGTGEDVSIKELAHTIKDITGFEGGLNFQTDKPEGTPRKLMDVSKAESVGWKAKTALDKGIKMVWKDYMKHYE